MKDKQIFTYVAIAAGLFLGYKLINNILVSTGLTKSEKEKQDAATAEAARKKELEAAKKKSKLTRPESEFYSAADTIWNALKFSSIDDDADKAQFAFTNVINSPADYAFLKYVYGIRPTYNFGLKQGDFDLMTTIKREFSDTRYNDTVRILSAKGVYI